MNTENVHYIQDGTIGFIKIIRPKVLNALNKQTLTDLLTIVNFTQEKIEKGEIHLVVLTGEQNENPKLASFIAGADIKELQECDDKAAYEISSLGQKVTLAIEGLKACTIAAVGGFCLGGGLEMALSCDFIWCTENSKFALPEVKLGLIPGFGGTQRLVRSIGLYAAREMIFSGAMINVARAKELKLVQQSFENYDGLIQGIKKFSIELESCSARAIYFAKNVIQQTADKELPVGLHDELNAFSRLFSTPDAMEGTKAFLEKRPANFKKDLI